MTSSFVILKFRIWIAIDKSKKKIVWSFSQTFLINRFIFEFSFHQNKKEKILTKTDLSVCMWSYQQIESQYTINEGTQWQRPQKMKNERLISNKLYICEMKCNIWLEVKRKQKSRPREQKSILKRVYTHWKSVNDEKEKNSHTQCALKCNENTYIDRVFHISRIPRWLTGE